MQIEHKIVHKKFVQYGSNAKEWMRKCVMLLPEIERHRIWEQKRFGSIYEYAAKLAGMSRNTVDDALRILRKIEDKPELQKVVEAKGLNAVRPVASIATVETDNFWAEKASIMSKNTLETFVKELRRNGQNGEDRAGIFRTSTENSAQNPHQQAIENFGDGISTPSKVTLAMQLDPEIADQLKKLKGDGDWNDLMKELLKIREAQLEEQKPEMVKTEYRHIPLRIKRYVLGRTKGVCSFPGCTKSQEILHHTARFALEKMHDPDRLEPLCKNHERLAHLGLIENENLPAQNWRVRSRPDETEEKYKVDLLVSRYRTGPH